MESTFDNIGLKCLHRQFKYKYFALCNGKNSVICIYKHENEGKLKSVWAIKKE